MKIPSIQYSPSINNINCSLTTIRRAFATISFCLPDRFNVANVLKHSCENASSVFYYKFQYGENGRWLYNVPVYCFIFTENWRECLFHVFPQNISLLRIIIIVVIVVDCRRYCRCRIISFVWLHLHQYTTRWYAFHTIPYFYQTANSRFASNIPFSSNQFWCIYRNCVFQNCCIIHDWKAILPFLFVVVRKSVDIMCVPCMSVCVW